MSDHPPRLREPIVLGPREGRTYAMPSMTAVFKADGAETRSRYCVSEWWLKPHSPGPGPHSHEENDEIFLVVAGTVALLVGETWVDAEAGTVVIVPAGVTHDFENRTGVEAGLFNVFIPGGFEENMPAILRWYEQNPGASS